MRNFLLIIFAVITAIVGFISLVQYFHNPPIPAEKAPKHNYIVLIDASSRIMKFREQDLDAIENHVLPKFLKKSSYNSKTELALDPNPFWECDNCLKIHVLPKEIKYTDNLNPDVFCLDLAAYLGNTNHLPKINRIKEFCSNIIPGLKKVYEYPKTYSDDGLDFDGADIHGYLNSDLKNHLDPNAVNHLLILTDGYVYMGKGMNALTTGNQISHMEGRALKKFRQKNGVELDNMLSDKNEVLPPFKSFTGLDKLEVLVLGINPNSDYNDNQTEEAMIIREIWKTWLTESGVNASNIKIAQYGLSTQEILEKFYGQN